MRAYENVVIYRKKTKRCHDKHIVRRNFEVGQQVLLYISRTKLFPRKFKFKWSGSFIVHRLFANGVVEVHNLRDTRTFMVKWTATKGLCGRWDCTRNGSFGARRALGIWVKLMTLKKRLMGGNWLGSVKYYLLFF